MSTGMYGNQRGRGPRVHQLAVPMALPRRRVVAMLVATMLIATCLAARLVTLQLNPPDRLIEFSESRASRVVDLVAPRGAIVDHYNRDLVLTTQAKTIAVDPTLVLDISAAAFRLAPIWRQCAESDCHHSHVLIADASLIARAMLCQTRPPRRQCAPRHAASSSAQALE